MVFAWHRYWHGIGTVLVCIGRCWYGIVLRWYGAVPGIGMVLVVEIVSAIFIYIRRYRYGIELVSVGMVFAWYGMDLAWYLYGIGIL